MCHEWIFCLFKILEEQSNELTKKYEGQVIPKPDYWYAHFILNYDSYCKIKRKNNQLLFDNYLLINNYLTGVAFLYALPRWSFGAVEEGVYMIGSDFGKAERMKLLILN